MKKIRIAVLGTRGFPGVQGGVESHCQELFTRLAAEKDFEITVYARAGYVDEKLTNYKGVRLVPLKAPRKKSLEAISHTLAGLSDVLANRKNYDIIHIHAIGPSLVTPLARLLGFPVIVTNHGPDYDRQKWGMAAKKFLRTGEFLGSKFASEVICVSRHIQSCVKQNYGRDSHYVPNGVVIPQNLPQNGILTNFGLAPKKYILAVGRLVPEKGIHDLLRAFKQLSTDWKLVIAGGADHEDAYSRNLREIAAKDKRVVMTGFIKGETLAEVFSNAGLFVLPSYHEGLPIALLEAMSYNLPVIASDIPANLEVVPNRDLTFPPGNIAAILEKMNRMLISSPEEIQRNREILEMEYNWDKIARQTAQIYKKIYRG